MQSYVCNEPTSRQNSTTDTFSNNGQKGNTICLQKSTVDANQWKETNTSETYGYEKNLPWELGLGDTQSDSIQCLNFAKKWFIQYSIQYCFTQDSIQNIIQFKINSCDSIQNIIQFNSQGMINTGRIGKVPKNCQKSVQNRLKGDFSSKMANIDLNMIHSFFLRWKSIHSFYDENQFKGLFNIIFFRNIQF